MWKDGISAQLAVSKKCQQMIRTQTSCYVLRSYNCNCQTTVKIFATPRGNGFESLQQHNFSYRPIVYHNTISSEIVINTSNVKLWPLLQSMISNPMLMVSKKIHHFCQCSTISLTKWKKKEALNKFKQSMSLRYKFVLTTGEKSQECLFHLFIHQFCFHLKFYVQYFLEEQILRLWPYFKLFWSIKFKVNFMEKENIWILAIMHSVLSWDFWFLQRKTSWIWFSFYSFWYFIFWYWYCFNSCQFGKSFKNFRITMYHFWKLWSQRST